MSYICRIELYLSYSYAWLLLFALAAGATTYWFYPNLKNKNSASIPLLWFKRVLRFLTLFLLLTLLLSPLLVYYQKEKEKPLILFYLDDSGSLKLHDSVQLKRFVVDWNTLKENLADDYNVAAFYFHETLQDTFSGFNGSRSNLATPIKHAHSLFKKYNAGAVILATDGIQNSGPNPLYLPAFQDAPLFVVGLGDSAEKKDIRIKELNHNAVVYLGNSFNCIANIQALGFKGKQVEVSLSTEGKKIKSITLQFSDERAFEKVAFEVDAQQAGYKRYTVNVSPLEGELSTKNNTADFYIEVVDGREKIAIVYNSPHPDIQAIRAALESNKNYEVLTYSSQEFNEALLKDLSLVIGHQYPRNNSNDKKIYSLFAQKKIPFWYILGAQSPIDGIGNVLNGLKIQRRGNVWSDAQLVFNPTFSDFTLSEELLSQWTDWPPLYTPFGSVNLSPDAQVLAYQSLNKVPTDFPLLAFSGKQTGHKQAFVLGEGMWRWRMKDKLKNNHSDIFDDLVKKIARLLMSKEEKRRFMVRPAKEVFEEDESVILRGEVFDLNIEPLPGADIRVTILNEKGTRYTYSMYPDGTGYALDAGVFESGYYTFEAEVKQPNSGFSKVKGGFLIQPLQIEWTESQADFSTLRELAAHHQGGFYKPADLTQVEEAIRSHPLIKTVVKSKKKMDELLSVSVLLIALSVMLGLEWFVRKWEGRF